MRNDRRRFLRRSGTAVLSATAVALLANCSSSSAKMHGQSGSTEEDISTLNVALGLEHEAISAYQIGAESGLLQKPVLDTAVKFQSQHKGHRDALIATIEKLGGKPVEPKSQAEYARALNVAALRSQADVLRLAARLELGAANAYLGVIPVFSNGDLAQVSGRLAADETMHWTTLTLALGEPLPTSPLSFGA